MKTDKKLQEVKEREIKGSERKICVGEVCAFADLFVCGHDKNSLECRTII